MFHLGPVKAVGHSSTYLQSEKYNHMFYLGPVKAVGHS